MPGIGSVAATEHCPRGTVGPVTDSGSPTLSRLSVVARRAVWPHEAHDFTPWLLANADVVSDLLGMDLDLETAEHPVGDFSLDLMGRDNATGQVVIVENQLDVSDHTHLGQILTYAAGTDPATIVWVAPSFRPEHRAALDWLNSRTDEATRFFGVEIGVVRIGDSAPAPLFRLVAQPNDWEKSVRAATSHTEQTSARQTLYREFWAGWMETVMSQRPGWSHATRPPGSSWFAMAAGPNANYCPMFTRRGLSSELVFEHPDAAINTARLQALFDRKDAIEQAYGRPLEFQFLPDRKLTRVAEYLKADIEDGDAWPTYRDWLLNRQTHLRQAIEQTGGVPPIGPTP